MGNYRVCVCFTRKFKSDALSPPGDVKDLFNQYSESGGQMTVKSLHRFLLEVQGQNDATEKDAEHVIEVLRQRRLVSVFHRQGLNLYGFFHFLFSEDLNPVINSKGSTILDESYDQDTTDLHKCIAFIRDCTPDLEKSNLILLIVGALGGRFDHELGNINVLYTFLDIRIVLLSNHSLVYLLPKTHRHEILIDHSVEGPHCGLVPVAAPSQSTTTSGLQWDLNKTPMSFGSLISTSNILRDEKVTVCSDVDLLWTSSIQNSAC